ncbi:galactosylgalactosylxylosylprotein 3-beta-glucuronosyltransferase I-like [Culicoides brevitarsis]|uniref:galactosylgalactosylxylosylprotein 3-beta-glucuronosyltransferase I-like n=1 Tax=Culicoides brevitarsis TaxID=469753 RepID=UPI00307C7E95
MILVSSSSSMSQNARLLIVLFSGLAALLWLNRPNCDANSSKISTEVEKLPTIYAITPTYYRPVQKAELTRLSQTLQLVPNVFWVIIEDATEISDLVRDLRKRSGLYKRSVQLFCQTPDNYKLKPKDPHSSKARGVDQRNTGLQFVRRRMTEKSEHAIVFFMDDDNTYSVELFREMAKIEKGRVGVWPVGLVGGLMVEKPIVDANGVVASFNAAYQPQRVFPIDMAGFAIAGDLLLNVPEAGFSYETKPGWQETKFLEQLTTRKKLQPLANRCMDVLVWHTRTQEPVLKYEKKRKVASDFGMEV